MVTILLWALVGGLAGLIFGVTAGWPLRTVIFVVLLGAGAAAVPLIEAELRQRRRKNGKIALPSFKPVPRPLLIENRTEKADGVLAPDEARQWLDEFLLKQQEK